MPYTGRMRFYGLQWFALSMFIACGTTASDEADDDALRLKTQSALQKKQYDANLAFAQNYASRCTVSDPLLPRVLVTGYGPFLQVRENISGQTVATLVGANYPSPTVTPNAVVRPEDFSAVASRKMDLNGTMANVCGMVLPVFWDLAPAMVAAEIKAFAPDIVVMNGVGYNSDPLRLELGSTNIAIVQNVADGTGILSAAVDNKAPAGYARVLREEPVNTQRASLFPYAQVRAAVDAELIRYGATAEGKDVSKYFSRVAYGKYPSEYLEYVCNNVIYTVNTLLDNPGQTFRLLENDNGRKGLDVNLPASAAPVVRAFVHWPPALDADDPVHAVHIMKTVLGAALSAKSQAVRGSTLTGE